MPRKRKQKKHERLIDICPEAANALMQLAILIGATSDAFDSLLNALPGSEDVTNEELEEAEEDMATELACECCEHCTRACSRDDVALLDGTISSRVLCDIDNSWHKPQDWCPKWPVYNG